MSHLSGTCSKSRWAGLYKGYIAKAEMDLMVIFWEFDADFIGIHGDFYRIELDFIGV